jgi:predicted GH43/DUF377 family glycosyl hydrolase
MMKAPVLAMAALAMAGCGRYADFTLPPLEGGDPAASYVFEEYPHPVLERGHARDVLNPSVTGEAMLYSEFDGTTWRTALARSRDGMEWSKEGIVLAPGPAAWEGSYIAANGSALRTSSEWLYWYVAGPIERPEIGLAQSNDARTWRKVSNPVLKPGPFMSWDEYGVADPYVIRAGGMYYMYFLGQDRAMRQRLGVARSRDGLRWQKLRANPIMELGAEEAFDERGLGEPAVWQAGGFYWMILTGRAWNEIRRLGLARSRDGVHWTKLPVVISGAQRWDAKTMCDPTVEEIADGTIRVWFGGGDVAHPVGNLNGQIGYGVLRPVRDTFRK